MADVHVGMLHCTFIHFLPISLVSFKKGPCTKPCRGHWDHKGRGGSGGAEEVARQHFGSSSLVVVGRIREGKFQPVGLSQEDAHFLIAPVHRR